MMKFQGVFSARASMAVGLVTLLLALGCDDKEAATSPSVAQAAQASPAAQGAETPAEDAAGSGQARYEDDAFNLELGGPTSVKVGETNELSLVLGARGGFKVNSEYPIKFKLSKTEGVELERDLVDKSLGEVDDHRAELPIKFKATKKGAVDVAGRLSFSVCTADRCLIERRDLKLTLDAS